MKRWCMATFDRFFCVDALLKLPSAANEPIAALISNCAAPVTDTSPSVNSMR